MSKGCLSIHKWRLCNQCDHAVQHTIKRREKNSLLHFCCCCCYGHCCCPIFSVPSMIWRHVVSENNDYDITNFDYHISRWAKKKKTLCFGMPRKHRLIAHEKAKAIRICREQVANFTFRSSVLGGPVLNGLHLLTECEEYAKKKIWLR